MGGILTPSWKVGNRYVQGEEYGEILAAPFGVGLKALLLLIAKPY